ncbi:GNAT family N-acetyltransferase [Streptomyces smyrnaeus]|uniref:GNAT family N-acetyltransferase n=1 Tax=Streptomyces smyrnaeus TaxID=1387713 RepID=A0ABS3XXZ2_9ACTN|nr:GNAT family N-acetyltransferase [Streptomyces smyrnaeus]MBO8200214.1 GNAT family N-acetyltransferase [Streptomyces smyrnaeus]
MLTPRRMTTERLLLRLPEDSDLDPLAALYNDPGALKNIGTEAHWSREQTLRILRESAAEYEQRGYAMYTVVRRSDGAVLGLCGLCPDEDDLPEIAGVLIRRHWGRGYCREAAAAVLTRAQAGPGPVTLTGHVEADHPALDYVERTVMYAHGFVFEKEAPFPYSGKLMRYYRWSSPAAGAETEQRR